MSEGDFKPVELAPFDSGRYNSLPSVEAANHRLRSSAEPLATIGAGLELIRQRGFGGQIGLSLVHRHFKVPQRHRMVEAKMSREGHAAWVTSATPDSREFQSLNPHRFILDNGGDSIALVPLEYSTNPAVAFVLQRFMADAGLIEDLHRFFAAPETPSVLGLMIPTWRLDPGDVPVETSSLVPPESVVAPAPQSTVDPNATIPTCWLSTELNGCCSPVIECYGWCWMDGDAHRSSHLGLETGHIGCG